MVKILSLLICLLGVLAASAQDTTFYNQNKDKVNTLAEADTYYILKLDPGEIHHATNIGYYRLGARMSEEHLVDTLGKILRDGKYKEYYKNGNLRTEIDYTLGQFDGQVMTYWSDGDPKRSDIFRAGKLIKGTCYDSLGKAIPHFDYYKLPQFPGGQDALMTYLQKHINYPKNERKNQIEGEELVQFTIQIDGSVTDIHMIQSATQAFSNEVIRIVKSMPKWEPGEVDGEPAVVSYSLPVHFTLK
jgi:TonB family protein